jgi:acyl carrier protein
MRPARPTRRQFVVGLVTLVPAGILSAQTIAPKPAANSCVVAKVKQVVFDQFGVQATRKMRFKEDLGADSLDSVEFTVALERSFGIDIPDQHCARLHTVGSVIDYLSSRLTPRQISNACSGKTSRQ